MSDGGIDRRFVERQRQRLLQLKEELERIQSGVEEDQRERREEGDFTQHDRGDQSQYLFSRSMDATLGEQVDRRLEEVNRALQKIEEGSYGVCDDTGERIPRGRLEAVPEAVRTLEAQQRYERERRPPA
ncbi:TraR/DksA family transcriptional regulator [Rubrobacter taiwanensis]|jgi:DnaK suppressor protein|uniref:TraR/DksA family transcriptional regulator n=1 Tax=Rubrobacter taiwanensis TaxID=185139 RepID=A0A4R1BAG4_9ACTN|nr:TraR/DksA C4-type zinc finger protein [Rubrobacter taiwanensis]TCJ13939.1 TraR/DksA family transcriptional regulator [Rubrobacter taiwanensis]